MGMLILILLFDDMKREQNEHSIVVVLLHEYTAIEHENERIRAELGPNLTFLNGDGFNQL